MSFLKRYWVWAVLSLPAALWSWSALTSDDARIFLRLLHPTGEFSARFLILALMVTPLIVVFRNARWTHALRRNRRAIGVAAFGYAALHTLFYVIDKGDLARVLSEAPRFYIWTGWLAFAVFVPLAVTSSDWFVRRLGRWWKVLQRATYASAVLVLLHWASLHDWDNPAAALVHFGPLVALEAYRVRDMIRRRQARAASSPA